MNAGSVILLGSGYTETSGGPPAIVRPFPPAPAGTYDHVLPWTPPQSRDFLRGDWWAVPCPGLPAVPGGQSGGSSEFPERVLTGLDYKYSRTDWWPQMVDRHLERGYTHWMRWASNALWDEPQYVVVSLASKVYDPRDMTLQQYQDRIGPLLSALLAARVVDEVIPAFEMDSFNVPGETTVSIIKWVGQTAHPHGVSNWCHFYPHVTAWFADGDPRGRFGFWEDLGTDCDGIDYQADSSWDVPELQSRIVDSLWTFGEHGNLHKFRWCEDQAIRQFSGHPWGSGSEHPNELDGSQRGFYACCTVDNVKHTDAKVWGYANGGMNDDGGWL